MGARDRGSRSVSPDGHAFVILGFFLALVGSALSRPGWPRHWALSGAPAVTFLLILASTSGRKVLPVTSLWTLVGILNLSYAVASTSWLFYGFFAIAMCPAITLACLYQFDFAADIARRGLRLLLRELQVVDDIIGFFDVPALEIDVDVAGLMVIRGFSIYLSTLTIEVHGVEVGIRLSEDVELAICTSKVTIALFRQIQVSDCFANVKGGKHEMTFGKIASPSPRIDGDVFVEHTALLDAAEGGLEGESVPDLRVSKSEMTNGREPRPSSAMEGIDSMRTLSPRDSKAKDQYDSSLREILDTDLIEQNRRLVVQDVQHRHQHRREGLHVLDESEPSQLRAGICSQLQSEPSVPHPPKRSISVTTLQNLMSPRIQTLLKRMPLLLRLLLNPIAYFHPVRISSITVAGSGLWISSLLQAKLFQDYAEDNRELRSLQKRILAWLSEANFIIELADIKGLATVPILTSYDIIPSIKIGQIYAYRSLAHDVQLEQVIRLFGADATFTIPSFLLPHHEHLLPDKPSPHQRSPSDTHQRSPHTHQRSPHTHNRSRSEDTVHSGSSVTETSLKVPEAGKDETSVEISAHAHLPCLFSQDLLDFTSAIVKASKIVEMEKEPDALEEEIHGLKDLSHALSKSMKAGMKRTVVDGMVSDRWIAKMVGKITRKLEEAQGDIGYRGEIPVKLDIYRLPEGHPEASKILV